jgi:cation diffusion facilitator family transporter
MIALLIGYEAVNRFVSPVPIHFAEAIPIACLGLAVNVASVWLLSGGHHHHRHGHQHGQEGHVHEEAHTIALSDGVLRLEIYEDGMPPRFRLRFEGGAPTRAVSLVTERPDGARQAFAMVEREGYLESADEIPEPHAFTTHVRLEDGEHAVIFEEHEHHAHGAADRDNNIRAAIIHVVADAAVSFLVIVGLALARLFGWLWMDPLAGIVGACVIASWSYGPIRDTGAILLDMTPTGR